MAFILFWSILLYFFFQRYVVGIGFVTEQSMLPLMPPDSWFLVNKYLYRFERPRHGDIVVVRWLVETEEERYVKRIIGLPGDAIWIHAGEVSVNGRLLSESYVIGKTYPDIGPLFIAASTYFVMGDNRTESVDSRFFGPVSLSQIEGKIASDRWFSFW